MWQALVASEQAGGLGIQRDPPATDPVETYEITHLQVQSGVRDLSTARLLLHPLRIAWHINPPAGAPRDEETDGLTLLQFFNAPGRATIEARLRWQDQAIAVPGSVTVDVVPNPDYKGVGLFGLTEVTAVLVAIGFAVATAMSTQYTWTFGSFADYLKTFLWAAGAGTGGNLFKQLGTTASPGGQANVASPAAAATRS